MKYKIAMVLAFLIVFDCFAINNQKSLSNEIKLIDFEDSVKVFEDYLEMNTCNENQYEILNGISHGDGTKSLQISGSDCKLLNINRFDQNFKGIGRLVFWYVDHKQGDKYSFIVQYSKNGSDWYKLENSETQQNFEPFKDSKLSKFKRFVSDDFSELNIRYIRIKFENFSHGSLIIDDLRIRELDEQSFIKILTKEAVKSALDENLSNQTQVDQKKSVKIYTHRYLSGIEILEEMVEKTQIGINTMKTVNYVQIRTSLSNPTTYSDFNTIKNQLIEYSNPVQEEYIDILMSEFEDKKNDISRFIGSASDVANILSFGKLNSVIDSFSSLFPSIYSEENLSNIYPNFKESTFGFLKYNDANRDKIKDIMNKGLYNMKKTKAFFEVIEEEMYLIDTFHESWDNSIVGFSKMAQEQEFLAKKYLEVMNLNIDSNEDTYFELESDEFDQLKSMLSNLEDKFIDEINSKGTLSQRNDSLMKVFNDLTLKTIELQDQYEKNVNNYLSFYMYFEEYSSINPFRKKDEELANSDSSHTQYFENTAIEWDETNQKAQENLTIKSCSSLKDKCRESSLYNNVKNTMKIDKAWKK